MNETLKRWAVEHLGVPADADDKQFEAAVLGAHTKGDLTWDDVQRMSRGEAVPDDKAELEAATELIGSAVAKAVGESNSQVADAIRKIDERLAAVEQRARAPEPEAGAGEIDSDRLIAEGAKSAGGARGLPNARSPIADYDKSRTAMVYPECNLRGRPIFAAGGVAGERMKVFVGSQPGGPAAVRYLDKPSQAQHAMNGAFAKWNLCGGGLIAGNPYLSDHEKALLHHCMEHEEWVCGESTPTVRAWDGARRLSDVKTSAPLINDTTSGGSYAVPRAFDDQLVMAAILYGELVPFVSILDLPAGSVVDGAILAGTLSITSNTAEGSAITLFDCTGLIGNLDTTIFTCSIGLEVGLDFLSDTPINFGQILPMRMGERLQEWLDNQICNGDGTTEPEGIFTKSGTGFGPSSAGTAGPATVSDVERMLFGLSKAERKRGGNSIRWVTSDTMYRRLCSIYVGSGDARRVLKPNMDHENYELMGRGVSIQNSIANGTVGICALDRYQLVRRLGSQFRQSTEGATLIKSNTAIMVLRARFGGQLQLASALYKMTDLDSTDG